MVVVPCPTPRARPPLAMVATDVAVELQVTDEVRFCVVPLLYVPVAVNCWFVPSGIEAEAGVTAMESNIDVTPRPLSAAVCGLPVALSFMFSVPVRFPAI